MKRRKGSRLKGKNREADDSRRRAPTQTGDRGRAPRISLLNLLARLEPLDEDLAPIKDLAPDAIRI